MNSQGMSLLELLLALTILSLASALVMFTSASIAPSQASKLKTFFEQVAERSFYDSQPLRVICQEQTLIVQGYQRPTAYHPEQSTWTNHSTTARPWQNSDLTFALEGPISLYQGQAEQYSTCSHQINNNFHLLFFDGLAIQSYRIVPSNTDDKRTPAAGFILNIVANGRIEILDSPNG